MGEDFFNSYFFLTADSIIAGFYDAGFIDFKLLLYFYTVGPLKFPVEEKQGLKKEKKMKMVLFFQLKRL